MLVAGIAGVLSAACADSVTMPAPRMVESSAALVSVGGVTPTFYPGNFTSSDDVQVCYDMAALGMIKAEGDLYGFRVDPTQSFNDGKVNVTISNNGILLDWDATSDSHVLAVIVKGGPNYNLYNYSANRLELDLDLASPLNGRKRPQISHYNVCYKVDPPAVDQGCTPGYWRNHADRWVGYATNETFDGVFGVSLMGAMTLGQAIWTTGGGNGALARHATAALLNAAGGVPNSDGTTVAYPYTEAEVIQMVQGAVVDGTIDATKDLLAAANELGCPLGGTKASKVS